MAAACGSFSVSRTDVGGDRGLDVFRQREAQVLFDDASDKALVVGSDLSYRPTLRRCNPEGSGCTAHLLDTNRGADSARAVRAAIAHRDGSLLAVTEDRSWHDPTIDPGATPSRLSFFRCRLDGSDCAYKDLGPARANPPLTEEAELLVDEVGGQFLVQTDCGRFLRCGLDGNGCSETSFTEVWEDGVLDVVAVFGHELDAPDPADEGVAAYEAFLAEARQRLDRIADDVSQTTVDGGVRLSGDLPNGRKVVIDATLAAAHLVEGLTAFDDWYDARTPAADLVVYSGHAALGDNVRKLTAKGVFSAERYVVVALNGCDTFAYVDQSFSDRLGGTKHADIVSNLLGGYFHSGDEMSLQLVDAFIGALDAPKTYAEVLSDVDETQIAVVTGEEDNDFVPGMIDKPVPSAAPVPASATPVLSTPEPPERGGATDTRASASCAAVPATPGAGIPFAATVALVAAALVRKRRAAGSSR